MSLPRKQRSKGKKQNTMSSHNPTGNEEKREDISVEKEVMTSTSTSHQKSHEKKTPPRMETSADSFDRQTASHRGYKVPEHDHVVITDGLTNVKERYHINPKE